MEPVLTKALRWFTAEGSPDARAAVLVASEPELCRDAGAGTKITAVTNPYLEGVVSAAQTVEAWEGRGAGWLAAAVAGALEQEDV